MDFYCKIAVNYFCFVVLYLNIRCDSVRMVRRFAFTAANERAGICGRLAVSSTYIRLTFTLIALCHAGSKEKKKRKTKNKQKQTRISISSSTITTTKTSHSNELGTATMLCH